MTNSHEPVGRLSESARPNWPVARGDRATRRQSIDGQSQSMRTDTAPSIKRLPARGTPFAWDFSSSASAAGSLQSQRLNR